MSNDQLFEALVGEMGVQESGDAGEDIEVDAHGVVGDIEATGDMPVKLVRTQNNHDLCMRAARRGKKEQARIKSSSV